ncbi:MULTISPECIES: helix-hairpin-helix domain-containing protein [unclassified Hydrogenophaga]|uniref:helix-hairpin-helix domain-containing protein n=1 Tax=unclassified Hydrogenophaga TaxID=2610897 RepID=UPI00095E9DDB|nr:MULTISPECIES: helix-hairpin-helix domain-containing protein [unclassified Hydrogenophaga]MBN9373245.1 DNA-binding protein [Hydrogenophaga sp.]OJV56688.1 MAG: DNA-binding protein [Hydrogenophaga sp. 70-12]
MDSAAPTDNARVALLLREAAALLAAQGANRFRVAAYRHAADGIAALARDVGALFEAQGRAGLDALPGIGPGLANAIAEILSTGRWGLLDRLRGEVDARLVFRAVPGVGPALSERLHDELGIDTLEALEAAAHDGRLAGVRGLGERRAQGIAAALAQMLDRGRPRRAPPPAAEPEVSVLLDVDREYRARAQAGELPTLSPRRFNPGGQAWLPVLHTQRGDWHFTALFSNTARAHELHREHDWVVLFFHDGDQVQRQHTAVTETRGPLAGRRVVRGLEPACERWYARAGGEPAP